MNPTHEDIESYNSGTFEFEEFELVNVSGMVVKKCKNYVNN